MYKDKYHKYKSKYLHNKNVLKIKNILPKIKNNEKSIYKGKCVRHLIDKLSSQLPVDYWIHMSHQKDLKIQNTDNVNLIKAPGIYYSKGGWIFHVIVKPSYYHFHVSKIDYSKIKLITTLDEAIEFEKDYGNKENPSMLIDWNRVKNDYNGFLICPNLLSNNLDHMWMGTYDVCSLAIWNTDSIIWTKYLLNASEHLNSVSSITENDFIYGEKECYQLDKLITEILNKIN